MKTVVVFLAEGFEEIEALTPVDLLRRAGIEVKLCSLESTLVRGSHDIFVQADLTLDELSTSPDMIILPGGMPGSMNLSQSTKLKDFVSRSLESGTLVGAICAAPGRVLAAWGLLQGKKACGFPGTEDLLKQGGAIVQETKVCIDLPFITSRGMGTAGDFSFEIVSVLADRQTAQGLSDKTVYSWLS